MKNVYAIHVLPQKHTNPIADIQEVMPLYIYQSIGVRQWP